MAKNRYEFWRGWKRKTELEEAAIKSIKIAKRLILRTIPRNETVSIYAKGSFVRREMNKKSDVDTVTIVKHSRALMKIRWLEKRYREKYKPQIQFTGYSIWELKNNKRTKSGKKLSPSPSRTVTHLDHYKLLYGKNLRKEDFNQGSVIGHLKGLLFAFNNLFIPGYNEGKFGFSEVAKQVFWLVELEQILKGKNPPNNWKRLARSIMDQNHIIHDALRFRLEPTKDKKARERFMVKLQKYLKQLERQIGK